MKAVFGGSGRDAFVVMPEPTNFRHLHHTVAIGGVDLTRLRGVHLQRSMGSPSVVVTEVRAECSLQVLLVDHDDFQAPPIWASPVP